MNHVEAQGRKEVAEAVVQAAIIAACTALINWGVETLKAKTKKPDEPKKDGKK